VDFYINFTLRQWTRRVERAHIIFSHDDWGGEAGRRAAAPPCHPPAGAAHGLTTCAYSLTNQTKNLILTITLTLLLLLLLLLLLNSTHSTAYSHVSYASMGVDTWVYWGICLTPYSFG